MKTLMKMGYLLLVGACCLSSCAGSYYVAEVPDEPVFVRPAAPYADGIWLDGDWSWDGSAYVYRPGRWEHRHLGRNWVRGTWEHTKRGYRWRRGHWE